MAKLTPDNQALYDALIDGLSKLVTGRSVTKGASTSASLTASRVDRSRTAFLKSLDKNIKTTDSINDALAEMLVTVKDGRDSNKSYSAAVHRASSALNNSSKTLHQFQTEVDVLTRKTLPEQRLYLQTQSKITKGLTTELGKSVRNQSLFSASLLESHTEIRDGSARYSSMIQQLYESSKNLSPAMLSAASVLDEKTGEIRDGLRPADFARLRLSLGTAETAIAESFGQFNKLGLGDMQQIISTGGETLSKTLFTDNEAGKQFKAALLSATLQLQAQGISVGPALRTSSGAVNPEAVEKLQTDPTALKELAVSIKNLHATNTAGSSELNKIAQESNTVSGSLVKKLKALGSPVEALTGRFMELANASSIAAHFEKFKASISTAADQIQAFNIAAVPASFANVQLASVRLGLSFQETVAFMQTNKKALALYGENFTGLTESFRGTFRKFGYSMAQGAALIGPAVDTAIASGVNVRNGDALNKFIDQSMQSFKSISGIVNITGEEYLKQNAILLSSQDVQSTLIGLDSDTAQARAKELVTTRDLYAAQGISVDMANELIRQQAAQKNIPIKDQLLNAVKLMQQAQLAGMSSQDAQRLQYLELRGQARDDNQDREFLELNKRRVTGISAYQAAANQQGIYSQLGAESLLQQTTPTDSASMDPAAITAAMNDRAKANLSPAEQAKAAAAATGDSRVALANDVANSIRSAKDNAFVSATLGASGALGGLALQALLTGRSLGTLRPGGGGIVSGIKSLLGIGGGGAAAAAVAGGAATAKVGEEVALKTGEKLGAKSLTKTLLKKIPLLGVLAGGFFGAQRAMGGDFTGAAMELGSGVLGSFPGLGTVAGLGLDAGLAARDIYTASAAPSTPPSPSAGPPPDTDAAVNNNETPEISSPAPSASGILLVQDTLTHDYLLAISKNTATAVELLQEMAPAPAPGQRRSRPVANNFTTGRQLSPN